MIRRLCFGALGLVLLGLPCWLAYGMTVPVPEFRTGTFADYQPFAMVCLTLYGGAALGVVVMHAWRPRDRRITALYVFRGSVMGVLFATAVALVVATVQQGEGGNLWSLLVVLSVVFAVLVSGGAALLWRALTSAA